MLRSPGLFTGARTTRPRLERFDAVLIGPGMLDEEAVRDLAAIVLDGADGPTFVLDAGALTRLAETTDALRRQRGRMVITPHTGEMATLLGIPRRAAMADLLGSAREAACRLQTVVALKGATTYIVSPQGEAWFSTRAMSALRPQARATRLPASSSALKWI